MAKHNIELRLPGVELGGSDARFIIHQDSEKLGELRISKGGIDYYPYKKKYPVKISWKQFDEMVKKWNGE